MVEIVLPRAVGPRGPAGPMGPGATDQQVANVVEPIVDAKTDGKADKDGSNVEADAFREAIGALGQGSSFTETPLDTTAEVAAGIPGGFFAEYPGKSSLAIDLDAEEEGIPVPSFRDAFSIKYFDKDRTNYQALGRQVVNHGVRTYVLGPSEGPGDWKAGYKDYVGALFVADARCGWADRGASGITTMAIQRGPAIASNEFAVTNPSAAGGGSNQATSMAAVQGIIYGQWGDENKSAGGLNQAFGCLVTNVGYRATAAFKALSAAAPTAAALGNVGADPTSSFARGVDFSGATIADAALLFDRTVTAENYGRNLISYDAGDFTRFRNADNTYDWFIGDEAALSLTLVGSPGDRRNVMQFASNDYLVYNQAADTLSMVIGGAFSWASGANFFNVASAAGEFRINGTKVVGPRQAAIADATAGTEITTINAILAALRAHGLINA